MDELFQSLHPEDFPSLLHEIPQPPTTLFLRGNLPPPDMKLLSIVGSRKYTSYGKQVIEELLSELAGYPIGIVSGLAIGIDSLAHEAALQNGLYTLAIPGGGLGNAVLYPARHKPLAHKILAAGGGLLSEYQNDFRATSWSFPQRNRLVAGISHATLLIEAGEKSGTLITARMATDYNRELLVVPGSIFSSNSVGVHQFLKLGATPVTSGTDILECLQIPSKSSAPIQPPLTLSPHEELVLKYLHEPTHRDILMRNIPLPTHEVSQLLMLMELAGHIKSDQHIYRSSR